MLVNALPLLVPAAGLLALFLYLESTDRAPTAVTIIWGILIVDSTLYASQNVVPTGILHPTAGSLSFRLLDVAIVTALVARLIAPGPPRRVTGPGLVWAATIAWILVSAIVGVYNDNAGSLVSFEAKVVIYLGAMILTAGVPFERYLREGRILRLVQVSAAIAAVLILTDKTGIRIAASIPGLPLVDAGRLGSDAGTLFAAIGVLALTMGLFDAPNRTRWMIPAIPLLAAAPAADQRAALLALIVSLVLLFVFAGFGGRRALITPTEMSLVALAAILFVLVPVLVQLESGRTSARVPYVPELTQTLYGRSKILSAQERVNQLRAARDLISRRPVFGWGLGKEFDYYRTGYKRFERIYLTHNILVDQWLRTGLVGLLLLLAAFAATMSSGVRAWFAEQHDAQAALLLGALCVMAGLIAKGLVENLFEKYRMVLLLGLMIGLVSSGVTANRAARVAPAPAPDRERRRGGAPVLAR